MEYLANKLTDFILKKGVIQEEAYEIYKYGFQCFLEVFINVICSVFIAIALDMVIECILFFVFFIPMRSYSGGLHMETYLACLFSSCIIIVLALLAVKYLSIPMLASFIVNILCITMIKILGPVNHPNREVDKEENLLFIKRTNFIMLINLLISVVLIITNSSKYLFLEAIVFMFLFITSLAGKIKYCN